MDVAASEFYKEDKTYDLNFKEDVSSLLFSLLLQTVGTFIGNNIKLNTKF